MTAYILKNIAILNVNGVDYRCILWSISENKAVNILNNSVLEDEGVLYMEFNPNMFYLDEIPLIIHLYIRTRNYLEYLTALK